MVDHFYGISTLVGLFHAIVNLVNMFFDYIWHKMYFTIISN